MSKGLELMETSRGWRIIREFRHKGLIWSPGAPPPRDLQPAEIASLSRTGYIAPIEGDNPFPAVQPGAPSTAAEYLRAQDHIVLLNMRRFKPDVSVIREILRLAEQENRSITFLEALRLILNEPTPVLF